MSTAVATSPVARPSARQGGLAGTGVLIRFILRRDRVRIPVWMGSIVLMLLFSVSSYSTTYPELSDRQDRADLMENPATIALSGPGYGLDNYTYGAMTANELLGFVALIMGLMSVLLFVRHTRAEEETGRAELIRATVVGRRAGAAAALVVVGGVNVVIGLLLAVSLPATLDELTFTGSMCFGVSAAAVGLVFTAIAAVVAQVTEHARGAVGLGGAMLAVFYSLRAAGDMGDGTLSWLSPFGWSQATRAYVDERWWPLLLSVALASVLLVVAFVASGRRDVGAGFLRPRRGRSTASARLAGPLGLAWRLQRASVISWSAGLFVFGLFYGTLVGDVEEFAADNDAIEDFLSPSAGATFVDAWLAMMMTFIALLAAGFAIQSALRLRGEEASGRAEPVLGAAVERWRWAVSHLVIALVGSAVIIVLSALGLGITGALTLDDADILSDLLGAAVANVPGVWLVVGLAMALYGLVSRAIALVWAVIAYAATIWMLGGFLQFPGWAYDVSPFGHVNLPAEDLTVAPVILLVVALGLVAAGLTGLRRRDLDSA